jgi:hypothetical protein
MFMFWLIWLKFISNSITHLIVEWPFQSIEMWDLSIPWCNPLKTLGHVFIQVSYKLFCAPIVISKCHLQISLMKYMFEIYMIINFWESWAKGIYNIQSNIASYHPNDHLFKQAERDTHLCIMGIGQNQYNWNSI